MTLASHVTSLRWHNAINLSWFSESNSGQIQGFVSMYRFPFPNVLYTFGLDVCNIQTPGREKTTYHSIQHHPKFMITHVTSSQMEAARSFLDFLPVLHELKAHSRPSK